MSQPISLMDFPGTNSRVSTVEQVFSCVSYSPGWNLFNKHALVDPMGFCHWLKSYSHVALG
jgi:hypothetical protein